DSVIGRRSLQFKVESTTKAFAERQPPRLVNASAKRRMDHQLHAAAFIEEALGNDRRLRRHIAKHDAAFEYILNQLLCAGSIEPALASKPFHQLRDDRQTSPAFNRNYSGQAITDLFAQRPELLRKFRSSRRSFTTPEGNRWSRALRVFHEHARRSSFHSSNAPRRISQ